ncbi:MAG: hypothetical protein R3E83_14980 [Burkholderiaceae bacterium]
MKKTIKTALVGLALAVAGSAAAQKPVIIKGVGTWGNLSPYQLHEGPFWNDYIAKASDGKIIGEMKPQTELGLKGFEIMRLVKNGVFDFAYGLPGYVAAENAVFEGADLSSVTQDIATQRKVADAYFPILEEAFAKYYNAKLLQLYTFPSQMLWCKPEIKSIADLKGKKIRRLRDLAGRLRRGGRRRVGHRAVRRGDSGAGERRGRLRDHGHDAGLQGEVGPGGHPCLHDARGLGSVVRRDEHEQMEVAVARDPAYLKKELDALTDRMWAETAKEDDVAVSCITGGKCEIGEPANMKLVVPTKEDLAARDKVATDVVLARWAKRCGAECAARWNETVGKIIGLTATAK